MDIHEKYEYWLTFDDNTKNELESITDKKEIEDRFYKDLEFWYRWLERYYGSRCQQNEQVYCRQSYKRSL